MRLSIRGTTYRGKEGFSISGADSMDRRVKIFVESREDAEIVKANVKANREQCFEGCSFWN